MGSHSAAGRFASDAVPLVVLDQHERWPYFDDGPDRRPVTDAWIASQPLRFLDLLSFALLKSCRSLPSAFGFTLRVRRAESDGLIWSEERARQHVQDLAVLDLGFAASDPASSPSARSRPGPPARRTRRPRRPQTRGRRPVRRLTSQPGPPESCRVWSWTERVVGLVRSCRRARCTTGRIDRSRIDRARHIRRHRDFRCARWVLVGLERHAREGSDEVRPCGGLGWCQRSTAGHEGGQHHQEQW